MIYCALFTALIQALDTQVARITTALKHKGVLNNTIIVFASDNGGPLNNVRTYQRMNFASNWPLRMGKGTLFEGGVRTLAFIHSKLLKKRGIITNQLFHISDWLPTLYEAAGGDPADLVNITGMSQWKSLRKGKLRGPRKELVNNIDFMGLDYRGMSDMPYQYGMVADRRGTLYKLIGGYCFNNNYTGWWVIMQAAIESLGHAF